MDRILNNLNVMPTVVVRTKTKRMMKIEKSKLDMLHGDVDHLLKLIQKDRACLDRRLDSDEVSVGLELSKLRGTQEKVN